MSDLEKVFIFTFYFLTYSKNRYVKVLGLEQIKILFLKIEVIYLVFLIYNRQ